MTTLLVETTHRLTAGLREELRRREGEKLRRQLLRNLAWSADKSGSRGPAD